MTSPGAIDHVLNILVQIEDGGGGSGEATCEAGMAAVWAEVLEDQGYTVEVEWDREPWGIMTNVIGTKGAGTVRVSHSPPPPPWVGVIRPGDKTLWVESYPPGRKINTIALLRKMRPDLGTGQLQDCVEGQRPVLENIDEVTEARAIRYLFLASVGVLGDRVPRKGPTTLCAVCKKPQFWTPSGICCENGHGGADSLLAEDGEPFQRRRS